MELSYRNLAWWTVEEESCSEFTCTVDIQNPTQCKFKQYLQHHKEVGCQKPLSKQNAIAISKLFSTFATSTQRRSSIIVFTVPHAW